MLIDTGNTSVIRGPKCHFFKIQDSGGRRLGKRAYLGKFFIDMHQIWYAYRYGRYKCHQGSNMSLFESSWKIHKRVYLSQFLTDCTKFGMLVDTGNVGVQNSTFWKFKTAAVAVLDIHERVYLGQFLTNLDQICVLINTGNTKVTSGP